MIEKRRLGLTAAVILSIMLIAGSLVGCGTGKKEGSKGGGTNDADSKVEANDFVLNTSCTISVYGTDDQKLADKGIEVCKKYEKVLSKTIKNSDVWKINNSGGNAVEVGDDTLKLIKKSLEFSKKTDGLFDITIGGVTELWDFTSENPEVPSAQEIAKRLTHVGYDKIKIEGKKVQLTDPETKIDLGAIAKGYIADRVADVLRKKGVKRAIINLGGNVVTIGEKQAGFPWKVGIEKPFSHGDGIVGVIKSSDNSIVTSGIYERQFKKNGVLYHHVIDPRTGWPIKTDLEGVSIISEKSVDGDSISTSCLLLGFDKGMELVRKTEGVEAVFIKSGGEIVPTEKSGFQKIEN